MNSMNDQHLFDLAMKVIASQCTEAERAELESAMTAEPRLRAEFERLRVEARLLAFRMHTGSFRRVTGGMSYFESDACRL